MKIICPQCGRALPPESVNVASDLALCPNCNNAFKASSSIGSEVDFRKAMAETPKGIWIEEKLNCVEIGISQRSAAALFLVPFTAVWSGFSMFGIYVTQFIEGKFDLARSLFGIPFLLGTIFLVTITLYMCFGKTILRMDMEGGEVFNGFLGIGFHKRFRWEDIARMESRIKYHGKGQSTLQLALVTKAKDIALGFNNESAGHQQRDFVLAALQHYKDEATKR